jgi:excisionase family DNA binding protein
MKTVKEVAEILGVCKMSVYRLIHSNQLEALKVGNLFRIEDSVFDDYLRKVRTSGGTASGGAGSPQA